MPRIPAIPAILASALLAPAAFVVHAQQLQLASPYAPPPPISSSAAQRAADTSPIQPSGPSRPAAMTNAAGTPVGATAMPAQTVRDARGQVVPNAVQVAPNRAYDPATGGYIQTTPAARPAQPARPTPPAR